MLELVPFLIVNGILLGGLYGCIASGFSIIFGVMKILDINFGNWVILGAFLTLEIFLFLGVEALYVLPLIFLFVFLLAMAVAKGLLISERFGIDEPLLISFGLALALENIQWFIWRADVRLIPSELSGKSISLFNFVLSLPRLVIFIAALSIFLFVFLLIYRTYFGKALRAVTYDWKTAEMLGISSSKIRYLSYAFAAGLGAVGGGLFGVVVGFNPSTSWDVLLRVFVAVTLGGVGSIGGTLLGGVVIGILENITSFYIGEMFRNIVLYLAFIILLLFKPQGLLKR